MLRNKSKIPNPCLSGRQAKSQISIQNLKFLILSCSLAFCVLNFILVCCYAQEQFIYDAKGRRNPFIPLVTPDGRLLELEPRKENADLFLEGIIYDEHGISYAIVNGEIVNVGDKVGEFQVLKIEKDKVIFIKEGQAKEVELKREEE